MSSRIAIAFAFLALCASTGARALPQGDEQSCEQAAATAELGYGLPQGVLLAISRVESGRRDSASGRLRPWPWTLNANGTGSFWPDRDAAVAAVVSLQTRGVSSIDVGCFQINLLQHPKAFPNLSDAFVPGVNADYAARFLLQLRQRTGDWTHAVMAYHSATPALGQAYWAQVRANWGDMDHGVPPTRVAPGPWTALASSPASTQPTNVQVWVPGAPGSAPASLRLANSAAALPVVTYLSPHLAVRSTGS